MTGKYLPQGFTIDGKYRLVRPIGSGGFSHVYQGLHTAMDRVVAIKIFDPQDQLDSGSDKAARRARRFKQEAQLVSQLEHPNTVTIYDFGVNPDGKFYLVMEFIEGPTLKEILRGRAPLPVDEVIPIFLQILGSLEEAHHRNILHRDLKPANIMITENFKGEQIVKVLDFGIARTIRAEAAKNKENSRIFLGTPRYAAPEQFKRTPLSLATDIYGVGALLWQCLVGEPMLASGDVRDCMAHASSPDPWVVPDEAGLPAQLCDIIERAVEKDPAQRYGDAASMMAALEGFAEIDRHDLPEIEEDDGLLKADHIVDPNILAPDDRENFFLSTGPADGPPPLPGAGGKAPSNADLRRPPSRRDNKKASQLFPTPTPSKTPQAQVLPTAVDDEASPQRPRRRQALRPAAHQRSRAMPRETDRQGFSFSSLKKPLLIVLAVVLAIGAALFLLLDDEPSSTDRDDLATITDPTDRAAPSPPDWDERSSSFMDASRVSVDGILIAMRADGWRVRQHTDPFETTNYRHSSYTVDRGNLRLDVSLYETLTEEVLQKLRRDAAPEHADVALDHILVRIRPRVQESPDTRPLAIRLQGFLQSYYELIQQQGTVATD